MKTRRNNCRSRKGCGCGNTLFGKIGGNPFHTGGYKPTKKNLETLRRWKRGLSIGFTATSSLKAKGLIPRTSKGMKGKYVVSAKYRGGGCGCSQRTVAPYNALLGTVKI